MCARGCRNHYLVTTLSVCIRVIGLKSILSRHCEKCQGSSGKYRQLQEFSFSHYPQRLYLSHWPLKYPLTAGSVISAREAAGNAGAAAGSVGAAGTVEAAGTAGAAVCA